MENPDIHPTSDNLGRRDATKIASASVLAGVSIPYVHGAPTNDTTRLALIGCGKIGRIRAKFAADYPGVEWFGLCDIDEKTGKKLAGDVDADGDVDLVLGAMNFGPGVGAIPIKTRRRWVREKLPVLILRNRTR